MENNFLTLLFLMTMIVLQNYVMLDGAHAGRISSCYPIIVLFGDSLSDTGNGVITGNPLFQRTTMPPYGETFPGSPAARFSDGRLIADFLATAVGLPLLNPSLNSTLDFSRGVNFAVSGATALNVSYLNSKLIFPLTPDSLDVQLAWYQQFKQNATSGPPQPGKPNAASFSKGLYILEIGGNDYNAAFQLPLVYTPAVVNTTLVPLVIQKIRNATEVLYNSGARNFLYISITPLGCSPLDLSNPSYSILSPKDSDGCLTDYNSVSYNHGFQLLQEVKRLRIAHPDAKFLFADYYGAYTYVLRNKAAFGFTDTLDACCGAGSPFPYNFNILEFCGNTAPFLCSNPNTYLNWDGIHLTDKFNLAVTNLFIEGAYLDPPNGLNSCASTVSG